MRPYETATPVIEQVVMAILSFFVEFGVGFHNRRRNPRGSKLRGLRPPNRARNISVWNTSSVNFMGYFFAALLSGFFLFNQAASPKKAAQIAEKALQKQYPSANIKVEIEGKRGSDVLKGRFRRVRVEMSNLTLTQLPFAAPDTGSAASNAPKRKVKIGRARKIEVELRDLTMGKLPVSHARLDFSEVQYDFLALKNRAQFEILKSGPAKLQLQLSAASLLPTFAAKLQNTENVTVSIEGKILRLNGTRAVLGRDAPILVTGELVGRGAQLRLENESISLNGATLPNAAAKLLLKDLNPLYDFDKGLKWPFRTEITAMSGQGNMIDLSADLLLPTNEAEKVAAKTVEERVSP